MSNPAVFRRWPILILIGCAVALTACNQFDAAADQGAAPLTDETATSRPAKAVLAERVRHDPFLDGRRFVGQLQPVSTVDMSFRVAGEIARMPATPGTVVPGGELIAALDPQPFNLGLRDAAAQLKLARSNRDRQKRLIGRATSQASLDQAEAAFRVRLVAMEAAQLNRQYARLTAPFDALIAQRLVYPHTNVQAGTPVLRVHDVTELRVEIALPQDLAGLLADPGRFVVTGTIGERDQLSVPLEYREHEIRTGQVGRTYRVVFGVSQPMVHGLLPGMTATVLIRPRETAGLASVSVPVGAIAPVDEDQFQVWVIAPDSGTVQPRRVRLGVAYGDRVPVIDGLVAGEQIVAAGAHLLRAGMPVEPVTAR